MKLLLIQPPIQDFYDTDVRLQPIGLCYLKAVLAQQLPEVAVKVRDFHQGWGRQTIPIPAELRYLREYYGEKDRSPFSVFHEFFHFGASFKTIIDEIAKEAPDLIGISSLFSPYYKEVLTIAELVKQHLGTPILLGGSHVSALPELMLAHPAVDYVIRGEGERPIVSLLRTMLQNGRLSDVPNLGFKESGELRFNAMSDNFPIQDLPIPDLSDLNSRAYRMDGKPLTFLVSSRSCPHRCSFCSVHTTFGRRYQRRAPNLVLEEIELRLAQGFGVIDFEDDNLTFYVDEMKELCRQLIARGVGKRVELVAMNGISYLSLDEELLQLMWQAGFRKLNIALVTSDTAVRETTKRPHTVAKYLNVVRKAHRIGFRITSYQILGLPTESLNSMIQTMVFAAGEPVLLGASMFYLTPNSPIARGLSANSSEDVIRARLTAMAVETEQFSREDLFTLFVTTRILNFFKDCPGADGEEIAISEALARLERSSNRAAVGVQVFRTLLQDKLFYRVTPRGWIRHTRFKWQTFADAWSQIEKIVTVSGLTIRVEGIECAAQTGSIGAHLAQ